MNDHVRSESKVNKDDFKSQKVTVARYQFRKYAIVYSFVKYSALKNKQSWMKMLKNISMQKEGFFSTQVLNFLANIEYKDSQYRLQSKQYASIIKEIVQMFRIEVDRVLSEENNEYHIISEQNSRMFKEFNRLNQFTEPLCIPQRLIGLDIYGCLHEINYLFQNSKPKINRPITSTLMSDITRIKQIKYFEASMKVKWKENFGFLDRAINQTSFGKLSQILLLVHIKRKISSLQSKDGTLQLDEQNLTPFETNLPLENYSFRGSHRFKYKFCELAAHNLTEKEIAKRSIHLKNDIARKIQLILERSQYSHQCKELHALMLEHKINFKALSEWINKHKGKDLPKLQQLFQQLKKYQWNLLKNDSFDILTKNTRFDLKEALSSQNFIGGSICKIALERFRQYATVLNIQNRLMKRIEKGASLYIKRFKYSYKEYYYIHHKDNPASTCASMQRQCKEQKSDEQQNESKQHSQKEEKEAKQIVKTLQKLTKDKGKPKEIKKDPFYTTIILAFSEDNDQFAFKYNQQIQDKLYIQHLVNFLKTKPGQKYNVFLSELDFGRNSIFETIYCKMVELFKRKLNSFIKFQGSPSKYFYHLLAHTYVENCLRKTSFETEEQFSKIISQATLKIIKFINHYVDNELCQCKVQDNEMDPQECSCEQSDIELLLDQFGKNSEYQYKMGQIYPAFDVKKIHCKTSNILMCKKSYKKSELGNISWQGETKYTKKGNYCQYYLKQQDKNRCSKDNEGFDSFAQNQDFAKLQQEISDIQDRLLKLFENNWPFLTDLEISNRVQNFVPFLKQVKCGVVQIKGLFRNITRNLIIYQAYFHELFSSKPEENKGVKQKYWKQITYLASFYNKQLENIDNELPDMLLSIFMKLLSNCARFPTTQKIIQAFTKEKINKKRQTMMKVQYKEEDYQKQFTNLDQQL